MATVGTHEKGLKKLPRLQTCGHAEREAAAVTIINYLQYYLQKPAKRTLKSGRQVILGTRHISQLSSSEHTDKDKLVFSFFCNSPSLIHWVNVYPYHDRIISDLSNWTEAGHAFVALALVIDSIKTHLGSPLYSYHIKFVNVR